MSDYSEIWTHPPHTRTLSLKQTSEKLMLTSGSIKTYKVNNDDKFAHSFFLLTVCKLTFEDCVRWQHVLYARPTSLYAMMSRRYIWILTTVKNTFRCSAILSLWHELQRQCNCFMQITRQLEIAIFPTFLHGNDIKNAAWSRTSELWTRGKPKNSRLRQNVWRLVATVRLARSYLMRT